MIKKRISEIVKEATTTDTITRITMDERKAVADLYEKLTGSKGNPICNACIIQMCYTIKSYKK